MSISRSPWCQGRVHTLFSNFGVAALLIPLLLLSCFSAPLFAGESSPSVPAPSIQDAILSTLRSGQIADAQNAVVDPSFILSLVTKPSTELPSGVRLTNAHFTSILDLSDSQIPSSLRLTVCTFDRGVDFTGTHIAGDLSLERSKFLYPAESKDFSNSFINLRVLGDTNLSSAIFNGPVDFTNAQFHGDSPLTALRSLRRTLPLIFNVRSSLAPLSFAAL